MCSFVVLCCHSGQPNPSGVPRLVASAVVESATDDLDQDEHKEENPEGTHVGADALHVMIVSPFFKSFTHYFFHFCSFVGFIRPKNNLRVSMFPYE